MQKLLTRLTRPAVLIPLVLGAATLVLLFTLSDAHKILADVLAFQRRYLLYFLLLMGVYFALRAVQWHYLLRALDIRAPLRTQLFAFSLGEITKSLPIGNYFQNYLLLESHGTDFGLSSVATTLILVTEVVVSLAAVLLLGLGGWSGWVRRAIVLGIAVVVLVAALLYACRNVARLPDRLWRHAVMRRVLIELHHYRTGARALRRPRVLVVESLLSAAYLSTAALGLYAIIRGFGIGGISLWQAVAVYFFSLAVGLIVPIPVDFGLIEVSGAGGLVAFGADGSAAVAVMLVNRVLSAMCSTAIGLLVAFVLHREALAAVRPRAGQASRAVKTAKSARRARIAAMRRGRSYARDVRHERERPLANRAPAHAGKP
jgi:glycosyltransferase 2 family protein